MTHSVVYKHRISKPEMSGQFPLLGVIIALLLLANWVFIYARSDQGYLFKDGDMKIVSSNSKNGVELLKATPSNDAAQVTAAQFGMMDSYFDAAAGLCPSQRKKKMEQSASQHDLLKVALNDFRLAVEKALRWNADTRSILDVRTATVRAVALVVTRSSGRLRQLCVLLRFARISRPLLALRVGGPE